MYKNLFEAPLRTYDNGDSTIQFPETLASGCPSLGHRRSPTGLEGFLVAHSGRWICP
jgi:hypothetical protein